MLISHLDLLATAPGGVARLRELILTLAVQGKLVPQDPKDEPASELLKKIRVEKDRLIAEGKIKRDKPLAAIAEEEKPFELPVQWEWVRLSALAELENGDRGSNYPSRSNFVDQGIAFINAGHLVDERIDYSDMNYITLQNFNLLRSGKVQRADILYCLRGSLGKFAQVQDDSIGAIASSLVIIRLTKKATASFVMQYLKSPLAASLIKRFDNGTAQPNLGAGDLAKFVVPLPPLDEQSRIVTRVEELMRLCDALEAKGQLEATQHAQLVSTLLGTLTESETPVELAENWQRIATHFDLLLDRPEAVDALEQTILQLAVRGLLVPQDPQDEPASELLKKIRAEKDKLIAEGKIKRDKPLPPIAEDDRPFDVPQGWDWVPMGELVNASEAGWSPTCLGSPRTGDKWGVLKVSAVSWGTFDSQANKELPTDLTPRLDYEVRNGDFLLSRANTEELVARSVVVGVTPPKLMLSDKIIRLDVSSQVNREFLNFCNNARHARTHYVENASGTSSSMKNVSREVVLKVPIALPPLKEQARIVVRAATLRALCANLRERLTIARIQQSLLAHTLA